MPAQEILKDRDKDKEKSAIDDDKTKNPFDYPKGISKESLVALNKVTDAYKQLWEVINKYLPQSRLRAMAVQDLEKSEAVITKAITFHGSRNR